MINRLLILFLFFGCQKNVQNPADFELASPSGQLRLSSLNQKVVLMYFGFLNCPDACPTTLSKVAAVLRMLPPTDEKNVEVLFIGLDPERDTLEKMREYTTYFHPKIIPLYGDVDEIRRIARFHGATFQKVKIPGAMEYTIDHTTELIVRGLNGHTEYLKASATTEDIMAAVKEALRPTITLSDVVIRKNPPGSPNAAGLLRVRNAGKADLKLIRAESTIAPATELHSMKKDEKGMMRMRPVESVEIKAGTEVRLDGSFHLMFMNVTSLEIGRRHPVTFYFDNRTKIETEAVVVP